MEKLNTKKIGDLGEDLAAEFLESNGVQILDRNYRTRYGEIDIIGLDGGVYVIFEVRAKKNNFSGEPIEAVHYHKQQKVLKMAKFYIYENKLHDKSVRIDAIGVTLSRPPEFNWVKNAIEDN